MNRDELLIKVKEQMTEHRYLHTLGVASTAAKLAERYGASPEKADLAGILHDYCKFWDKEKMKSMIQQETSLEKELLLYDKELWHAPVGAHVAETELKISDAEVLDAIRYHTSGRPQMGLLEKILWLADYIEPGRRFPGVEEVREAAEQDLDEALVTAMGNSISFLAKQRKRIYPLTLAAYNDLLAELDKRKEQKDDGI